MKYEDVTIPLMEDARDGLEKFVDGVRLTPEERETVNATLRVINELLEDATSRLEFVNRGE